jgi:hypothetical protein
MAKGIIWQKAPQAADHKRRIQSDLRGRHQTRAPLDTKDSGERKKDDDTAWRGGH